jgi:hypothetical protein
MTGWSFSRQTTLKCSSKWFQSNVGLEKRSLSIGFAKNLLASKVLKKL